MDLSLFAQLGPGLLLASMAVALAAGIIKGAVGFAMPLVMVSGLSSILSPQLAIAGLILPVVASNALQTFRQGVGPAMREARFMWRYLLVVGLFIVAAAQLVPLIAPRVFYILLGVPVVILSLIQLSGVRFTIPDARRRASEWIIGALSGILGGLAGTWGPTTVLYLIAIDIPKARQMILQGVIYGTGSVMLLLAHLQSGIFNAQTAPFSATLLLPAFLGMAIGFRLQDRMDQERFRTVTLVVLTVAGVNLIRKGVMGG
ncbi:MAG: sulfite exporter TauE/SafE family protein [Pseudomonadota bacterium]